MNYYQRHIGDYAKDTRFLSTYQHGVYALLLDWYYSNEKPIPLAIAYRVVQARTGPERRSVDEVLDAFFDMSKAAGFAHNKRADIDIAKYKVKAQANSLIAKERESTKRARNVVDTCNVSAFFVEPSHKPVTNNQKKQEQKTVQAAPAPCRFLEFWAVYPNKKSKQEAEKSWLKLKLDSRADELIQHVRLMQSVDEDWLRGAIPMGSTYLNQARWDDVPKRARSFVPSPAAPSRRLQTLQSLEDLKNGLDHTRDSNGLSETLLLGPGAGAGWGRDDGDGDGVD